MWVFKADFFLRSERFEAFLSFTIKGFVKALSLVGELAGSRLDKATLRIRLVGLAERHEWLICRWWKTKLSACLFWSKCRLLRGQIFVSEVNKSHNYVSRKCNSVLVTHCSRDRGQERLGMTWTESATSESLFCFTLNRVILPTLKCALWCLVRILLPEPNRIFCHFSNKLSLQ